MRIMKDSGVEWIGQIPEGWSCTRMKYLASEPLQYGANATGVDYDASLPRYIRITDITEDINLSKRIGSLFLLIKQEIICWFLVIFYLQGAERHRARASIMMATTINHASLDI